MIISFIDDEPEIFPMQYGGKARTIINLAKKMSNNKEVSEVRILSRSIKDKRNDFVWEGIHFIKLDGYSSIQQIINEANTSDVLNIHTCSFTFPLINKCRAILIYHLHDVILATADKGSHLDKAMGGNWDAIISPSDFATSVLHNFTKWKNFYKIIFTIPRGIDSRDFRYIEKAKSFEAISKINASITKENYPIIFFPHRVDANKGEQFLFKLCKNILNQYPSALVLASLDSDIDIKIPNLINLRWVSSGKLRYYYSISDVVLNFSLLPESFSQVCLESVLCGTPVLAFRFGNLSSFADELPAVNSCEPNDKDILLEIQKILVNKPRIVKRVKESQKIIAQKYNMDKVAEKYLAIYDALIQKNKSKYTKLNENITMFFISPLVAKYNNLIYVSSEDGKLRAFNLNKDELLILNYCSEARSLENIIRKLRVEPRLVIKIIEYFVDNKIIVKV